MRKQSLLRWKVKPAFVVATATGVNACVSVPRPSGSSFTSLHHPPRRQRLPARSAFKFPRQRKYQQPLWTQDGVVLCVVRSRRRAQPGGHERSRVPHRPESRVSLWPYRPLRNDRVQPIAEINVSDGMGIEVPPYVATHRKDSKLNSFSDLKLTSNRSQRRVPRFSRCVLLLNFVAATTYKLFACANC